MDLYKIHFREICTDCVVKYDRITTFSNVNLLKICLGPKQSFQIIPSSKEIF